ncbi:hypothetical protein N9J88_03260 [Porticoccaceae bacterium]|nr:hypothetical protein [Porticoccaceae bacterium]
MKWILNIITVAFLTLAFTACSSITSPGKVLLEAKLADSLLQSGIVETQIVSVDLTAAELQILINSLDEYQKFRSKWASAVDSPETIPINLALISQDYIQLYGAYMDVKNGVVLPHWDEYSPAQRGYLAGYLARAQTIDRAFQELLAAKQSHQAASQLLELAVLAAQLSGIY